VRKPRNPSDEPEQTLAERLAPMSIAEIDAMSDQEVAELMGATVEELAARGRWLTRACRFVTIS
jgi:hypothetical protein